MIDKLNTLRPFQIAVMGAFGVLALIGLIVFATYKPSDLGTANVGKVVVWGIVPADAMEGAMAELTQDKSYRGVSYEYVRPESFASELANALAAGAGPDLILISQEELMSQEEKLSLISFDSIPERTYRDKFASLFEIYLTKEGTYGIPMMADPMVLYYNRATLSASGIASPPTTWAGVRGLVNTLTTRMGESIAKSAIPFGSYGNVTNARGILSTLFLQAGSRITGNDSQGRLRSTIADSTGNGTGNPVQGALLYYAEFADPVKPFYTWNSALQESRQAFLSGSLAFYPGYASEARSLASANPNLDFDMARMPQPEEGGTKTVYAKAYAFSIPKVSKNQAGAYMAALALSGSGPATAAAKDAGMAPALRALIATPPEDLYSPVFYPDVLIARGWLSPAPSVTDGIFAGMMQNVISGRTSVSEALKNAAESITASLD